MSRQSRLFINGRGLREFMHTVSAHEYWLANVVEPEPILTTITPSSQIVAKCWHPSLLSALALVSSWTLVKPNDTDT